MNAIKPLVVALAVLAGALPAANALAGKHVYTASDPEWKAECGSCHVAYPPALLPARSWRAVMAGLDRHFGTDASLDPAAAARITAFLERHAGRDREPARGPVLRITETRWFVREHDEVPADLWNSPKVKSAASCSACHAGADRGDFSERGVRLPK